ncbi:MAG: hypothetical protein ACP5R5_00840 [Armatimonadota bacterium]
MKKLATLMLIGGIIATCSVPAGALTFDQVLIESWCGTGSNQAVLVVDFGPASFAFGYRFDGPATGWDMLSTTADQTDLDITVDMTWGSPFITGISYHGYSGYYDSQNWQTSNWWEYWTSSDGETWSSSWVGCGDRALSDGAWDGWTWSPPWPATGTPPDVPVVPEPSSLNAICFLVGLAGVKLLRRK